MSLWATRLQRFSHPVMLTFAAIALFLVFVPSGTSAAAVMSVDLGSEWMKVSGFLWPTPVSSPLTTFLSF